MKRWISLSLVLAMALTAGGCATVKRKFTRKSTQGPARPVVYTEKEYIKPYTNEYYYTNNFNMWKVWQEELLGAIGGNSKHIERSGQEAVARLKEMQGYLIEPKASELGEQIAQVDGAARVLQRISSNTNAGDAKFTLEKTLRVIKSKFYTDDVKLWIKKDEIKL
jgi:hypothetical protein